MEMKFDTKQIERLCERSEYVNIKRQFRQRNLYLEQCNINSSIISKCIYGSSDSLEDSTEQLNLEIQPSGWLGCPDRPLYHVTSEDWICSYRYLASLQESNPPICNVHPLALYNIGLYIWSETLIKLALCVLTPKDAPEFLRYISDPEHCRYVQQIIDWYGDIENVIKRKVCLFCGGQSPNIKLPCCNVPVHYMCLEGRGRGFVKYPCPKCNHFLGEIKPQSRYVPYVKRPRKSRQTCRGGASPLLQSPYSTIVRTYISEYHPNAEYLRANLEMFVSSQPQQGQG